MKILALLLTLLTALPATAQSTMTAEEFDAYSRGKTLYFGRGGEAYGAERYYDNRRVEWSFLDGDCKAGFWYERDDGLICFEYEDRNEPQCWSFRRSPGGLIARFEDNPAETELYEAQDTDKEMVCKGPDVGA